MLSDDDDDDNVDDDDEEHEFGAVLSICRLFSACVMRKDLKQCTTAFSVLAFPSCLCLSLFCELLFVSPVLLIVRHFRMIML